MIGAPQSLKDACRWVFFLTDFDDWEIATDGGTLFIVSYQGVPYGLTAKHNLHSYEWKDLLVTTTRQSSVQVGLKAVSYPGTGLGYARESDLMDIAVIQFAEDVTPATFEGSIYNLDVEPVCVSCLNDDLVVYGALTTPSSIGDRDVTPTYAELGFVDCGPHTHDPVLRSAKGQWINSSVSELNGLSGGPVYNTTRDGLCGMVVRGGVAKSGIATTHFIDISDIVRVLDSVHQDHRAGFYTKSVLRPKID